MKTIKDIETAVERAIDNALEGKLRELGLLPSGYRCAIRLQGPDRDKSRTADFDTTWDPNEDSIRIEFEEGDTKFDRAFARYSGRAKEAAAFRPVVIRGEPLSTTVSRDRR